MKRYHLTYMHTSGVRLLATTDIEEFSRWLDKAIEDEYVATQSINVYVEDLPL